MGHGMGQHGCGLFGMRPGCRDFFKQLQTDWDETNEMSPSFLRNKPDVSGLTVEEITDILEGFLTIDEWDLFLLEFNKIVLDYDWRYGVNAVSTLSGLPVSKASVVCTLGGNSSLSLSSAMKVGQNMNVKVVATAALTVALPTASGWVLMDEDSLALSAGDVAEINVWCTGDGDYSVKTIVR